VLASDTLDKQDFNPGYILTPVGWRTFDVSSNVGCFSIPFPTKKSLDGQTTFDCATKSRMTGFWSIDAIFTIVSYLPSRLLHLVPWNNRELDGQKIWHHTTRRKPIRYIPKKWFDYDNWLFKFSRRQIPLEPFSTLFIGLSQNYSFLN